MKVSCYAKEPKEDDLIGVGEIDISETLESGEFDGPLLSLLSYFDSVSDRRRRLGEARAKWCLPR